MTIFHNFGRKKPILQLKDTLDKVCQGHRCTKDVPAVQGKADDVYLQSNSSLSGVQQLALEPPANSQQQELPTPGRCRASMQAPQGPSAWAPSKRQIKEMHSSLRTFSNVDIKMVWIY